MVLLPLVISRFTNVELRIVHSHNTMGLNRILQIILRPFICVFSNKLLSCGELASKWMYGKHFQDATIINLPIDSLKFLYNKHEYDRLKTIWKAREKIVFGYIGRLSTQKNPMFLLEVYHKIHNINNETMLIIVGKGEYKSSIIEKIKQYNLGESVILIDEVSAAYDIINGFDGFILPSLYEGFPTVLIEAQANGLPCYISDKITKKIELTDLVSFLSLSLDSTQWANYILDDIIKKRKNDRKNYASIVAMDYDVKIITKQVESIYRGYKNVG